ncbi:MAG: SoxR reducing system RseC family protein [Cellvibrionaceae bacterium]|nr:SoxR reducing system RseC family protein [Cellvibrionaceae bacterium]
MLSEVAQVVAVESDGLWVVTEPQSACQKCQAQRGCGQKLLASHVGKVTYVKALFESDALAQHPWSEGQEVIIGIEEQAFLSASLLAYLFPLITMIAVMLAANFFYGSEAFAAIGALLGLLMGGMLVKVISGRLSPAQALCFQAKVISQVDLSRRHLIASQ